MSNTHTRQWCLVFKVDDEVQKSHISQIFTQEIECLNDEQQKLSKVLLKIWEKKFKYVLEIGHNNSEKPFDLSHRLMVESNLVREWIESSNWKIHILVQ